MKIITISYEPYTTSFCLAGISCEAIFAAFLSHLLHSWKCNLGGRYIWWSLYLVVVIFGGRYIWWYRQKLPFKTSMD